MEGDRKAVQIYLRIKGPPNPALQSQYQLLANNTKIRFKSIQGSQEQEIINELGGVGVFKFEKIFKQDSKQEDIYMKVASDLILSALDGYNGTIFAYGQTGSGKTYTMTGGDDQPSQMGIIPRLINELYKQAQTRQQQVTIKLKYMQIYKKNGYDLLNPLNKTKKLEQLPQVKAYSRGDSFQFDNLSQHDAPNFEQAMKIYEFGDTNRIVCKTPSNDQSSRSHCIFIISIKTKNRDTGVQQKATINLVDLAGSERVHNSGMEEAQAKQGISINLGLHYLSRVVIALGEQSRTNQKIYIPYRDSLLTMALKSSMGGNCKTRMIATINPNPIHNLQNIATCRFSQNLLCIQNKIKKNQFINPWDIIKGLKNEIQELKGQISRLKGGQEVKQILEREDYIKIHKLVDEFVTKDSPIQTLPINDRLHIREYLSYMKSIIREKYKKQYLPKSSEKQEVSSYYILEVKNLKQQIQQKQNQIQLLLTLINDKKHDNPQDSQQNLISIEDNSEQKIAETVISTLNKSKLKKDLNITLEDVEKNLLKPIQLNDKDDVEEAFKKFKDAHIKSQDVEEKDHELKLKEMRKEVLSKKIKILKIERAKLYERIRQVSKKEKVLSGNSLPGLTEDFEQQQKKLKQDLADMDEKIKKRYKQLKNIQIEIDRIGLFKNKATNKIKNQFNEYMSKRTRRNSEVNGDLKENSNGREDQEIEEKKVPPKSIRNNVNNMSEKENDMVKADENEVEKHMQQFFKARQKLLSQINAS